MIDVISINADVEFGDSAPKFKVLINNSAFKEVCISFKKGQELKDHSSASPIIVQVIKGMVNFGVDSHEYCLKEGMLITLDAKIVHKVYALQESIIRLSISKN